MSKKQKRIFIGVVIAWFLGLMVYYLHNANIQVLNPKGQVARQERNLIVFTVLLGLLVVLPVFAMTFTIAWKYREGNTKSKYRPDWDHNVFAETLWWAIPTVIIAVLSVVAWNSSHSLNPPRHLSSAAPMQIQVVALDWKWLFIYPDQGVASVNYAPVPVNQPVDFEITSNGPMNSFWVPQLGGQIYAMAGMSTNLNLVANQSGDYRGSSANISGKGFSGMNFLVHATSAADFKRWAAMVRQSSPGLNVASYDSLARPSVNNPVASYAITEPDLYDRIVLSFMSPEGSQ